MTTVTANEGDTLAYLAWRHYGRCRGPELAAVIEANPARTAHVHLHAGDEVRLPALDGNPSTTAPTRNWNLL